MSSWKHVPLYFYRVENNYTAQEKSAPLNPSTTTLKTGGTSWQQGFKSSQLQIQPFEMLSPLKSMSCWIPGWAGTRTLLARNTEVLSFATADAKTLAKQYTVAFTKMTGEEDPSIYIPDTFLIP